MKIKTQFPELSMHILEMPITIPNVENPKINQEVLQEYYDSLRILLKDYIVNHIKQQN
jgi:hemerythrin